MLKKNIFAIVLALLAAILYGLNMPFAKTLLNNIEPAMLASYLYLGAGLGIGLLFLITNKKVNNNEKFKKKDIVYVLGMIILDIAAPILLMFGLLDSASSNASLLNNFEIVCTSLIALLFFSEKISKKMWIAIVLITISSFVLSVEEITTFKFSWGSLLVLLATLCWGLENNCTKNLSSKNTYFLVILKGVFSGLGSLIVALCLHENFSNVSYILLAMLLGFVAYGLSIFFYIRAQRVIGAAKTSAYYSIAPFVGTFLSFLLHNDELSWIYFIGLIIMIIGTILVVMDTIKKDLKSHSEI